MARSYREMSNVIELQPVKMNFNDLPLQSHLVPPRYESKKVGCCYDLGKMCLGMLAFLFFPFALCFLWCYASCSIDGRFWFFQQLNDCYMNCCCKFDCLSEVPLYDLIKRYQEFPLPDIQVVLYEITSHPLMVAVMKTLHKEMPDLFFSFLPSGSLRERFGKLLPSTSSLATDFDIMFIPDAIEIGFENEPGKAFSLVRSENFNDGYFWLKLNDNFLTQWSALCLKRYFKDGGYHFLSSEELHYKLQDVLEHSNYIKRACALKYGEEEDDVKTTLRQSGPAMTIEVISKRSNNGNKYCRLWEKTRQLFHADYTLAIHCTFWPDEALGFFDDSRRAHWPEESVIQKIKMANCHVVPKRSRECLVKISLEQAPITRWGLSPGLEWRYSFSQAEIFLSECLPEKARTSFIALKAVAKKHLNYNRGDKLASYVLKTILLYEVEKKPLEYWDGEERTVVEEFFLLLLKSLTKCLYDRKCPHYWIPTINLLQDFSERDLDRKAACCQSILECPNQFVGDNWLEYTRCLRYKCCFFGSKQMQSILNYEDPVIKNFKTPNACCSAKYSYDTDTYCCGPCDMDHVDFDVY